MDITITMKRKTNKTLISVVATWLICVFVSAYAGFLMTKLISYEMKAKLIYLIFRFIFSMSLSVCKFRFNLPLFSRALT